MQAEQQEIYQYIGAHMPFDRLPEDLALMQKAGIKPEEVTFVVSTGYGRKSVSFAASIPMCSFEMQLRIR